MPGLAPSSGRLRLYSDGGDGARAVLITAHYTGLSHMLTVDSWSQPEDSHALRPALRTPSGVVVHGPISVCKHLIGHASPCLLEQLLGRDSARRTEIEEWVLRSSFEFGEQMTLESLRELSDKLKQRTFLAGSELTLADILVYSAVAKPLCSLAIEDRSKTLCHLARWFLLVQNLADRGGAGQFPPLYVKREQSAISLLPPPPPPKKEAAAPAAAPVPQAKSEKKKSESGTPAAAAAAAPAKEKKAKESKKDKGGADSKDPARAAKNAAKNAPKELDVSLLDIRVGRIESVERHPNADGLYVEKIDMGEEQPRQIISGLVKFMSVEHMVNKKVLVLANVKPSKMRDVMSQGMVLCASNSDHTVCDFVLPPEAAPIGDKVTFEGYDGEPEEVLVPKKKQFEKIAPDLSTDASGVASYKGVPFMTSCGQCTSAVPNAIIK